MKSLDKGLLRAGAASLAIVVGAPAIAQDAEPEASDASQGNVIVVTANKREQNLNDVGLSVTAVGAQALEDRKITSLEDVASVVPGLVYTPSTANTPIFTLRGVGFNESSLGVYPAVSVYVDQVPLPFPVMAMHSAYDLERIEVLKGPQGTLFGQNSTGGAINYIAAGPTSTFEAGGDISYGRFNAIDGNAYISGPISDVAGFRLAVAGRHADGWQESYTRDDSLGEEEWYAGRLTIDVEPSSALRLRFTANGWKDKSEPQAQQLIAVHEAIGEGFGKDLDLPPMSGASSPLRNAYSPLPAGCTTSAQFCYPFAPENARAADWGTTLLDPNTSPAGPFGNSDPALATFTDFKPFADHTFYQFALRADLELGAVTLTSLTSYADYDRSQRTDGDGMAIAGFDLQIGEGNIETFNQELRLSNDPGSRFRWMLGANYESSSTFEDQRLRYFGNSNYNPANLYINTSDVIIEQEIENWAVFANTEFDITDQLTLKAAARYTDSTIEALNCGSTGANGNVDKLFNILGGLSGLPFTPIGPGDCYTLNSIGIPVPEDVTVTSPLSTGGFAGLGIPGIPFEATLAQDNVSWRAGLDYKLSPDVLLYANVSRGYKAGSFPALAAAAYTAALPVVQEKVTAYEAGIKAGTSDGTLQINAAGFYMDYQDKQVRGKLFDVIFGTLDTLVNVPESRIYGFEVDATLRPIPEFTVTAGITYLNSKINEFVGYDAFGGFDNDIDSRPGGFDPTGAVPNVEDFSGVRLPYTPSWSGVVNFDYRPVMNNGGRPFIGATINFRSDQSAAIGGDDTTLPVAPGRRFRLADYTNGRPLRIDGYETVDARVGYEGADGTWRVMLWGKNVFNKYYWTAVIPSSDTTARLAGKPATYGVAFGFDF